MRKYPWAGILALALLFSLGWGVYEHGQQTETRLMVENQNKRAFTDLAAHLDRMETALAKSRAANSSGQGVLYFSQLAEQSEAAGKEYAQIPAETAGLSYVGQFITQLGDMARGLAYKTASGGKVSSDEEKTLAEVHNRLIMVNRKVQELVDRTSVEKLAWLNPPQSLGERIFGRQTVKAAAEGQEGTAVSVRGGLEQLDANLQKMPPFTYTGEFSTHSVSEPLGLPSGDLNRDQAAAKARAFLEKAGYGTDGLKFSEETQGTIPCYVFKQQNVYLEITKRGGVVRLFRDFRSLGVRAITVLDAKAKALNALQSWGWSNMVVTSTEDFGAYVQVALVNDVDGVRYYPDKVMLTVAMDNGQITGLDATPYWAYHHARSLPKAEITLAEAKKRLKTGFLSGENRLAIIAAQGDQEILCYEFRGRYEGEDYLVYVNAVNGTEEQIKRIIKTPRGEYLQ